jgi:hypothetical protein
MRHLCKSLTGALLLSLFGGCAAPIDKPLAGASPPAVPVTAVVFDLRAADWKMTKVLQNSQGVVQHLGDDKFPGGDLPHYLAQRLALTLATVKATSIAVKTTDIRLSVPGAKIDQAQLAMAVTTSGLVAAPMFALLSTTSRNKSASAVFCLAIDGRDYLGNDARLFSFGPEGELRDSIDAAIGSLAKNITAGITSASVACEPGWEGGQARP